MKILIFHTYNRGYLSSFFHELSVKLTQDAHEVVCFSWKNSASNRVIDGVQVIVKKKEGYITNYRNVFNIIKKVRPDVILSNFSYVNPALLFGRLFRVKKSIVWFHSLNDQTKATMTNVIIKSSFLKLSDLIIANSHHTKNELHHAFKVPKLKIKTIPFWCSIEQEVDDFKETAKDKSILKIGCPGRLVEHKNQKVVLEALAYFSKNNYEFHIAGNGEYHKTLQEQSKQLGIENNVVFRGHLTATEMIVFYKDMDLIVLPSLSEAFGLVFIEAISLGTPVIVSSQFGALTFIENKKDLENITFNPKSSDELIAKLEPYFNSDGLPSVYFQNLYNENFDKNTIYSSLYKVIVD